MGQGTAGLQGQRGRIFGEPGLGLGGFAGRILGGGFETAVQPGSTSGGQDQTQQGSQKRQRFAAAPSAARRVRGALRPGGLPGAGSVLCGAGLEDDALVDGLDQRRRNPDARTELMTLGRVRHLAGLKRAGDGKLERELVFEGDAVPGAEQALCGFMGALQDVEHRFGIEQTVVLGHLFGKFGHCVSLVGNDVGTEPALSVGIGRRGVNDVADALRRRLGRFGGNVGCGRSGHGGLR